MRSHHGANPTQFDIEKGYPDRTQLSYDYISWGVSLPDFVDYGMPVTNLSPQHGSVVEKLARQGLEVPSDSELIELSRMSQAEVATHFGSDFADRLQLLRYPLGRTGLNGVGIFYEAGAMKTADIVVFNRDNDGRLLLPLVYTRSRWNTPGGFYDDSDGDISTTALRELEEETGHDLATTTTHKLVLAVHETKDSDRTADHGWIEASVFTAEVESQFPLEPIDTNEVNDVRWVDIIELPEMVLRGKLSEAKKVYIEAAADSLGLLGPE